MVFRQSNVLPPTHRRLRKLREPIWAYEGCVVDSVATKRTIRCRKIVIQAGLSEIFGDGTLEDVREAPYAACPGRVRSQRLSREGIKIQIWLNAIGDSRY